MSYRPNWWPKVKPKDMFRLSGLSSIPPNVIQDFNELENTEYICMSVFDICMELHMDNNGGGDSLLKEKRELLRKALVWLRDEKWHESHHNSLSFDTAVLNLINITLNEKNWRDK